MSTPPPQPRTDATNPSARATDIRIQGVELYFLPVETRMPLKFGTETLTSVTCARVRVVVEDRHGRRSCGWGETPLNVQWVWPSEISYAARHAALLDFCEQLADAWADFAEVGHPMEIGHAFQQQVLPTLLAARNRNCAPEEVMPLLAGLVCCSPFDIAVHDAYGNALSKPVYETYSAEYMNHDLAHFLQPAEDADVDFFGKYPLDYCVTQRATTLPVWHLVGGLDPLRSSEVNAACPDDGEPVILSDWIERDGINCLKIKLRGNDAAWDYQRLVDVGSIARSYGEFWLTADFNCMVSDPAYVNEILDRLQAAEPAIFEAILYVEQPFPYDLQAHRIDVHSVSARKPLLMDESAHNWQIVRLGRELGWTGVALKTCKTQTGAILSLCWAKAHGMHVMVQDLTNPMLAQIPHVLLAAHAGTMMGVESNAMQFYPHASTPEARVHPGLYQRRNGILDLATIEGTGFGYRLDEIDRTLDAPAKQSGDTSHTTAPRP